MIRGRLVRAAVLLVLSAAVSACTLFPKRDHGMQTVFLLNGSSSGEGRGGAPAPGRSPAPVTVLVNLPRARPGFDTPRMAYLPHPQEVRYYAYHEWADTPGRMLAPMVVDALERSGCCRMVARMVGSVPGDIRLDIEDLSLGQEFFSAPSVVRLSFRALLVGLRGRDVIAARRFEAVETAPSEDPRGGASAAGDAVRKVLAEMAEWVAQSVAEQRGREDPGHAPAGAYPPAGRSTPSIPCSAPTARTQWSSSSRNGWPVTIPVETGERSRASYSPRSFRTASPAPFAASPPVSPSFSRAFSSSAFPASPALFPRYCSTPLRAAARAAWSSRGRRT